LFLFVVLYLIIQVGNPIWITDAKLRTMKISNRFYDVFAKNRLQQLTICIYKIEK